MTRRCHYWKDMGVGAIPAPADTFLYLLYEMKDGHVELERERVYAFGLRREQLFVEWSGDAVLECTSCGAVCDPTLAETSVVALVRDGIALTELEDCSNGIVVGLFTGPDTPSEKEIAWGAKELKEKIARSASKAAKAQAERAAVLQSVQP